MKPLILALSIATTSFAALAATAPAHAYDRGGVSLARHGTATPAIDRRQAEQAAWIQRGRRNGTITWFEYRRLTREQGLIAAQKARALSDGRVNRFEKRQLWQAQDGAARNIQAATNNSRNRFGWWHRRGVL